eukprot:TRINITY_DN23480_c0_g1_i1.p1 TRINITY_DN23480_c0_g1~~TRINITY_DN23480_c0_g1_i1.p1  ORF type:complete len:552 (+),score=43.34 TRINITY_DN23480_c0_g1_i1:237-1658(+)
MDRRISTAIYGVLQFLPAWSLLVFGLGRTGLWSFASLQVLSGLGSGSNVLLVLASDVTHACDKELAFGAFYALSSAVSLLGQGIPLLLIVTLEVIPNDPGNAIWISVGISLVFFGLVGSIKNIDTREKASASMVIIDGEEQLQGLLRRMTVPFADTQAPSHHEDTLGRSDTVLSEGGADDTDTTDSSSSASELPISRSRCCAGIGCCNPLGLLAEPFKLLNQNRMLALVCAIAAVLEFAQDLTFDVQGQFYMSTLDLVEHGDLRDRQMVTILSSIPVQVFSIFAYAAVGLLANRCGPLRFLRLMIPLACVMVMAGGLMNWFPHFWFIPIVSVTEYMAGLTSVALQLLIVELAPEGRLGEAMGVVGMCKQLVGFAGNAVVASVTPALLSTSIKNPLWLYYPTCGLLKLLGLCLLPFLVVPNAKDSDQEDQEIQSTDAELNRERIIALQSQTSQIAASQALPTLGQDMGRRSQMW